MKRRTILLIFFVATTLFFSHSLPVFAQSYTTGQEDLSQDTIRIIDNTESALTLLLDESAKLTQNYNKARYERLKILVPKLNTFFEDAKKVYTDAYDTSLDPQQAQIKALNEYINFYNTNKINFDAEIKSVTGVIEIMKSNEGNIFLSLNYAKDPSNKKPDTENAIKTAGTIATGNANQDKNTSKCSISFKDTFDFTACVDSLFAWLIKTFLLSFAGTWVWLFGTLFHLSIYYGILNFADWMQGDKLYPLWQSIRDVVNLLVVFFGMTLIIMYLINKGDKIKQFIPWLIIYALFVNFSWTIMKTVIDYSNIITLKLYSVAVPGALSADNTTFSLNGQTAAGMIMQKLGLQSIVTVVTSALGAEATQNSQFLDQVNSTPVALLLVVLAFYTAYVFLLASFIFMWRTAVLVFAVIGSPFLMIDMTLPYVGEYAKKAREVVLNQLVVGAVFMILFFLVIQVMEVVKSSVLKGAGQLGGSSNTGVQFFGVIMMLILLHIMIKVVKKLSGEISGKISGLAGTGMSLMGGGVALAGRKVLGGAATRIADSKWLKNRQATVGGRAVNAAAQRMANSTYDLRNLGVAKSIASVSGIPLGAGLKQNYQQSRDADAAKIQKTADSIPDKAARERYLRSQMGNKGTDTLRGLISPLGADFRSANTLRVEDVFLKEYEKAKYDPVKREKMEAEASKQLRSQMEEMKKKEQKEAKEAAEEKERKRKEQEADDERIFYEKLKEYKEAKDNPAKREKMEARASKQLLAQMKKILDEEAGEDKKTKTPEPDIGDPVDYADILRDSATAIIPDDTGTTRTLADIEHEESEEALASLKQKIKEERERQDKDIREKEEEVNAAKNKQGGTTL